MAFSRKRHPAIYIAANSPLYAPLLLAKAEKLNETSRDMALRLSKPPISFKSSDSVDPLIEDVLSEAELEKEIRIGIGDPMRIASLPEVGSRYAEPRIIGSLIQRMCFWLVDHREVDQKQNQWEQSFFVLSPPKGMTGYTVLCYDYYKRTSKKPSVIQNRLAPELDPNDELGLFERAHAHLSRRGLPPGTHLAFITTNPLIVLQATAAWTRYSTYRHFIKDAHFIGSPPGEGAVMTGLLVAEELAAASGGIERDAIENFKDAMKHSIARILHDPRLAAYCLHRGYTDGQCQIEDGEKDLPPYFASWTIDELEASLRKLASLDAFNPSLKVFTSQWARTIEMRDCAEELLPIQEKRRSANSLLNGYCVTEPA